MTIATTRMERAQRSIFSICAIDERRFDKGRANLLDRDHSNQKRQGAVSQPPARCTERKPRMHGSTTITAPVRNQELSPKARAHRDAMWDSALIVAGIAGHLVRPERTGDFARAVREAFVAGTIDLDVAVQALFGVA